RGTGRPSFSPSSSVDGLRARLVPEPGDDVVDRLLHRVEVPEVLVVDAESDRALAQLLLQRLDELDERKRVGFEVLGEVGLDLEAALVDLEDLPQPLAQDAVPLVGTDRAVADVRLSRHRSPP